MEDDGSKPVDQATKGVTEFVQSLVENGLSLARWYPAKVLSQAANGTLEVLIDSEELRGTGMRGIPIRHGLPGVSVQVTPGAKVAVLFEDGDASKPAAALWPTNAACVQIDINPSTLMNLCGGVDFVALAAKVDAVFTSRQTYNNAHVHPVPMGGSTGPPTVPMPAASSVAATKVKAT